MDCCRKCQMDIVDDWQDCNCFPEAPTIEDDDNDSDYLEYLSYQDNPERDAGEAFQDKYDTYRNEH